MATILPCCRTHNTSTKFLYIPEENKVHFDTPIIYCLHCILEVDKELLERKLTKFKVNTNSKEYLPKRCFNCSTNITNEEYDTHNTLCKNCNSIIIKFFKNP